MIHSPRAFTDAVLYLIVGTVLGCLWLVGIHNVVEPPLYTDQVRWLYVFEEQDARVERAVEIGVLHLPIVSAKDEFLLGSESAEILVTPPSGKFGSLVVEFTAVGRQGNASRVSVTNSSGEIVESAVAGPQTVQELEVPLRTFVDSTPFPKRKLRIECAVVGGDGKTPSAGQRCAEIIDLRWRHHGQIE